MPASRGRLPGDGPRAKSPAPRVCIATGDLAGPIRNGGVGTACATLAEALVGAGHSVTILYVGPFEAGDAEHWQRHFRDRGVTFEVPPPSPVRLDGTVHTQASYLAYQWLKAQPAFDVVQFPEIGGVGFYSIQAKRLGLAFHRTYFCVVLHSPTLWHRVENRQSIESEIDLTLDFLERESVAHTDGLVSPTRYLLSWAEDWGFTFPREVYVEPYVPHLSKSPRTASPRRPTEIVFFGRLESRKGIELFCDALELLAARGALAGVSVTFLGKAGRVRLDNGADFARRRTAALGVPVRLETGLGHEEAIEYLKNRNAIAVLPSLSDNMPYALLECLSERVPFIAARTGGIPEMIAEEDHPRVLAEPDPESLSTLMESAIREGQAAVRPAHEYSTITNEWVRWHEALAARMRTAEAPTLPVQTPLVSVCIATRNRPAFLQEALESVRTQTYPHVEVVIVDDASDDPATAELYARLHPEFDRLGWHIIRRSSRGLPSCARNTAAAHARGEYLLFMDDDNLARPHEIETFVAAALHSAVPILTCIVDHFSSDVIGDNPIATLRWLPLGPAMAPGLFANKFGDTNMLIRRETFLALGGFDEHREAAFAEDWILLSRAAARGIRMAVVPEPLFWYRSWTGGNARRMSPASSRYRRLVPYLEGQAPDARALTLFAAGVQERSEALSAIAHAEEARARTLAERFTRASRVLIVGPGDAGRLRAAHEVECVDRPEGILLRSGGTDPIVWLPAGVPPGLHSLVRIDLTCPGPTILQLFWSTWQAPHPTEWQSTIVGFPAGRSIRWAEIPAAEHVGRLRLDPACAPGDYILHGLEVRCEGSPPHSRRRLLDIGKALRRTREDVAPEELFQISRQIASFGGLADGFMAVRGVEVLQRAGGTLLRSLCDDPQIELRPFPMPRAPIVARLDVTVSEPTTAQIFWATAMRGFCEKNSVRTTLTAGRNVSFMKIPANASRCLRFDPATAAIDVLLHSLEFRAAPRRR